jgi:membrane protein YdbS with pleckstrin-like domain
VSTETLRPDRKYRTKLYIILALVAGAILLTGLVIALLVELEENAGLIALAVTAGIDLLWWIPGMLLVHPYYKSLRYEVEEEQVIVYAGVWTQSVKHVPYRTVTNITIKRGILDRWLGLGTLEIQTAGMSGSQGGPEQGLVGLPDARHVYQIVADRLRRFRGGMAPTAAETEGEGAPELQEILEELRAIRRSLEK